MNSSPVKPPKETTAHPTFWLQPCESHQQTQPSLALTPNPQIPGGWLWAKRFVVLCYTATENKYTSYTHNRSSPTCCSHYIRVYSILSSKQSKPYALSPFSLFSFPTREFFTMSLPLLTAQPIWVTSLTSHSLVTDTHTFHIIESTWTCLCPYLTHIPVVFNIVHYSLLLELNGLSIF